ncbi:uncharacterized protein [Drosophila takahashii]|uniref:uncharacterized protein n=1 Tax=Drosophila takahashii TaxID=29030 RepID=UPI001CF90E22|nr:uncharacterized protein LOC108059386 [Drosophila takahashii]XP_017000111.2 uncharacterized protein LOC108059388 [Drosophila takahashii]
MQNSAQGKKASGEDACSSAACKVAAVVSKTKRKSHQFVTAPCVMPKPLVVDGNTAIFQVGGEQAKMGDIPALSQLSGGSGGQPIYRIKPGTHAHVVNYIVVDEGCDSNLMKKANSGDPEAMRQLLGLQRGTAVSKLQKLIAARRGNPPSNLVIRPSVPTPGGPGGPGGASVGSGHVSTPQMHPDLSIASVKGGVPFVRQSPR